MATDVVVFAVVVVVVGVVVVVVVVSVVSVSVSVSVGWPLASARATASEHCFPSLQIREQSCQTC